MASIRIAHFSDLHADATLQFDQRRIVQAALADLANQHAERSVDLAIVSGDLAFSGVEAEFALAEEILLAPLAGLLEISLDRVIIVPGNHDVDRRRIIDFLEDGLQSRLRSREAVNKLLQSESELDLATERLSDWYRLCERFYEGVDLAFPAPLARVHHVDIGGCRVGVAALNSAWRASGGDEDLRRLLIGDVQIEPALAAISDAAVQLVVTHHPVDWLAPSDGDRVRQYLGDSRMLVLSGHEHVADPQMVISRHGSALYSRTGCLYETHEYRNSYQIIDLDLSERKATFRVRSWYPERETGVFAEATDVAHDGKLEFQFGVSDGQLLARLPFSQVTGSLADVAQQTSVIRDAFPDAEVQALDDVLIGPRFLKVPYREAVAAATIRAGIDPELLSVSQEVGVGDVLVVCGDPQFGVTSAILWLLALQYSERGAELPVFLRSDSGLGTARSDRTLSDAAARAGYSSFGGSEGSLPPLVIGIDDVAVRKPNRLARLTRYVAEHREHGYILGCHGEDHRLLAEALEAREVSFQRVFLAPFGRRELRQLVRKLVGSSERGLIDRIFRLIRSQGLPRSPLTMAALIAVLHDEEDPRSINESGLLQAYVNYLLGGSELSDAEGLGMDYRKREHLLAYIAHEIHETETDGLARLEAEQRVATYFTQRGLMLSPGRILQSLIDRRVLAEEDGIVSFRHGAFLQLFIAKWMLEDSAFATSITTNALDHAAIVKHVAGLRRSDRALLETVGTQVLDALAEVVASLQIEVFDETLKRDAEPPELEELRKRLQVMPGPPDETTIDEQLDRIDDTLDQDNHEPDLPKRPIERFGQYVTLLCDVLRNSELVDDVELKTKLLTDAVRTWSVLAVAISALTDEEELFGSLRDVVMETDGKLKPDDVEKQLRRFLRMLTLMLVAVAVSSSLGSNHLGVAIESALDDPDVMASPTRAWILTMLFCHLELPGWPDRLAALYERYPEHVFLQEVIADYALTLYRTTRSRSAATKLEPFLADVYAPEGRPGPARVETRASERSQFIEEIRAARLRYQRVGPGPSLPSEALDFPDEVPPEPSPGSADPTR